MRRHRARARVAVRSIGGVDGGDLAVRGAKRTQVTLPATAGTTTCF